IADRLLGGVFLGAPAAPASQTHPLHVRRLAVEELFILHGVLRLARHARRDQGAGRQQQRAPPRKTCFPHLRHLFFAVRWSVFGVRSSVPPATSSEHYEPTPLRVPEAGGCSSPGPYPRRSQPRFHTAKPASPLLRTSPACASGIARLRSASLYPECCPPDP